MKTHGMVTLRQSASSLPLRTPQAKRLEDWASALLGFSRALFLQARQSDSRAQRERPLLLEAPGSVWDHPVFADSPDQSFEPVIADVSGHGFLHERVPNGSGSFCHSSGASGLACQQKARARAPGVPGSALTQRAEAETCARRQVLPSAVLSHPIVLL